MFIFPHNRLIILNPNELKMDTKEGLKESREMLHLTQSYVAKVIGISLQQLCRLKMETEK